jgi:ABC-type antimicrobial peptide transport system ATPase subunit
MTAVLPAAAPSANVIAGAYSGVHRDPWRVEADRLGADLELIQRTVARISAEVFDAEDSAAMRLAEITAILTQYHVESGAA